MVKEKLLNYIENLQSPVASYELAMEYYKQKQYPTAFNYFLRAAELSEDDNKHLAYECLLYCSNCLYFQKDKMNAAMHHLMQAKAIIPSRVEGRYLHARILSEVGEFTKCYEECRTALTVCDYSHPLIENVGYPGQFAFEILLSISGWKIGRRSECREIIRNLHHLYVENESNIPQEQKNQIIKHAMDLKVINSNEFEKGTFHNLKFKFPGYDKLKKNYSHSFQDLIVISLHNGKRNGTYLEIGSCFPYEGNNTALLEESFDWTGVSVEYNEDHVKDFNANRKNKTIHHDARSLDYSGVLSAMNFPTDIDYLQIDCEPSDVSYEVLQKIPFDKYRFAVITFEHDFYQNKNLPYRDWSRSYLIDKGYIPVVNDVAVPYRERTGEHSHEDWWIHPALIDPVVFQKLKVYGEGPNRPEKFLFE